jgi:shikimate kinase
MDRPVLITGFMGAGKTTVAFAVAQRLNCLAVDLDGFITREERRSPKEIINEDGEGAFRAIETSCLQRVLAFPGQQVIALGGGAWTLERNRELIAAQNGLTVWLDVPFELCWQRIKASGSERPLAPSQEQAKGLYDERRELYKLAWLHVFVEDSSDIENMADFIAGVVNAPEANQV